MTPEQKQLSLITGVIPAFAAMGGSRITGLGPSAPAYAANNLAPASTQAPARRPAPSGASSFARTIAAGGAGVPAYINTKLGGGR